MTMEDLDVLENVCHWLRACLECESYHWDSDQREAAEDSLTRANRRLVEFGREAI